MSRPNAAGPEELGHGHELARLEQQPRLGIADLMAAAAERLQLREEPRRPV